MTIVTQNQKLSDEDKQKIKDIFAQSNCPNESLVNTFPSFNCIRDNVLYFCDVDAPCKITEDIAI